LRHAVPRPGKTSPGTPNVTDFKMQPKPKMTTTIIITITIIGVTVFIWSDFYHYNAIGQQKQSNSAIKRKIRAITPLNVLKVIKVGINKKPVCDLLLYISD